MSAINSIDLNRFTLVALFLEQPHHWSRHTAFELMEPMEKLTQQIPTVSITGFQPLPFNRHEKSLPSSSKGGSTSITTGIEV